MAGGDLVYNEHYHYARVPIDRIITGLCHIVVTHSTDEDDAVEEYYTNWGSTSSIAITGASDPGSNRTTLATDGSHGWANGDVVWIDGTTNYEGAWEIYASAPDAIRIETPYVSSQAGTAYQEGANDPPIGAQYSKPFIGTQTVNPDRTGYGLRLGDHDTFLFNVTAAVHLAAAVPTGGTTSTSGYGTDDSETWYTEITHPKCQSFVRSTLLSRHNNAYGIANNFYKYGIETNNQPARAFTAATAGSSNMMHNGVYSDEDENFEKSFSALDGHSSGAVTNNSYFTPVYDIKFEAHHVFTLTSNVHLSNPSGHLGSPNPTLYHENTHPTDFYNLLIKIKLYSFDKDGDRDLTVAPTGNTDVMGGTTVTHFRNRTNVYWQPFGETSELKFSKTPFTS